MTPQFGLGAFCLRSPGGLIWTFGVDSEDNLTGTQTQWGFVQDVFFIGNYALTVADDGTLSAADTGAQKGVSPWKIYNDNEELFYLTVEPDLSILLTPEA